MNRISSRSASVFVCVRGATVGLLAIGLVVLPGACKRKETAGGGTETAAPGAGAAGSPHGATPAAAPAATNLGPKIADKADAGQNPFAGIQNARALALDDRGRIWIADFGNAAVRIFDANGGLFGGWGGHGDGPYAMKDPCGIAVHGDSVYVVDTWRTGVEIFTMSGERKATANASFYAPHGIAVASDGRVVVADSGNDRLVFCDADLGNPRPVGKSGSGPEQFSAPVGVAVGPSGKIYVTDVANKRIQVLDGQGRFTARFKFNGWGDGVEPYVGVDSDESLFVTDPGAPALVHVDRSGRELKRWTAGDDGRKFLRPTGVAVDRKNRVVLVMNTDGNFVSRIRLEK